MADSEPSKTTKRRLRAPAPTVRQQAEKAQATADKPKRNSKLRTAARKTGTPFAKVGKLFNRQPFRFISKVLGWAFAPAFARNAFKELRMVTWPNAKQTARLTFAVLAFAVVFGVAIGLVDFGLDKLFRTILLK